jgi:ABC-type transporter Mla subunit MlaD
VKGVNIAESDHTALEIKVEIDPKVPVTVDARAFLSSVGLLGDYYIEIMPGQPNSKRLPPGSYIPSVETTQFAQLTQPVEEISQKLQVLIERLSDLMNDQSRQHVASMIATLDCLLIRNAGNVDGILDNLQATTANIQKISQNLDRMTSMEDSKIDQTWKNVNQTVADLQMLTQQLQQTAGHLNQMVVTNDQNLAVLLMSIQETTDNLKDFTQQIKERPWNLIRKTEPKPRPLPKD